MSELLEIPRKYRVALAGKAALLGALFLLFLGLTAGLVLRESLHLAIKIPMAGFFALCTWFLGWTTWLAGADVLFGKAIKVSGAQPLPSRRSGISFKLADGGTAEYLLVNTWAPTQKDRKYGLTIGKYSHVIIEEPRDEGPAEPVPADWREQRKKSA